jgi:pimeloyl-ACP methyl ester carboxylesterase
MNGHHALAISHGSIHYLTRPALGPVAHFLHANGCCAGTYAAFLAQISSAGLHVTASDLRGHGDTRLPLPDRLRDWDLFVDDLTVFIEKTHTPPIVGVGHSLGAVVTYLAAARNPRLFSRIVLIDPVFLPRRYLWMMAMLWKLNQQGRMPLAAMARRRKRVFSSREAARQRFTSGRGMFKTWQTTAIDAYLDCALSHNGDGTATLKCDPEWEAQIFESVPRDVWSYASRIRCPVLTLRGEFSDTFTPGAGKRLSRLVPDCRVITIKGTGHFLPMEAPETVARHIAAWTAASS